MNKTAELTNPQGDKTSAYYNKILLSNIKHDLTNPINAVLGYAELILDYIQDDENIRIKSDINKIHESGSVILENINDIFSNKNGSYNNKIGEIINNPVLQFSIRTPLSTIIGLTELLSEDIASISEKYRDDVQNSIDKIFQAGKVLLQVANDLNKYSESTIDELLSQYKTDLYSKDAASRIFKFDPKIDMPTFSGNILIVEDDSSNLELLEKIIIQSNHSAHCARNGEEALEILGNQKSNIDLILLDLIMPEMNGIELLEKIKANKNIQHIPVIMLSAVDELEPTVECITLGADDFLFKPINRVLLNARINNALEKKLFRDKELKYQKRIKQEQEKSETLLLNILPGSIAARLKDGETLIADDIENASVLFADLTGFTKLSSKISAGDLVLILNNIFSIFDELVAKHSLEKIKTIGDNYMIAGGLPEPSPNHAISIAEMALDMLEMLPEINKNTNQKFQLRIGINSGPLSAGVIGKKKFSYDLWGDTVNIASRMETYGEHDKIHVSERTYNLLKKHYQFKKRNKLDIQGKGVLQTYFLTGRK